MATLQWQACQALQIVWEIGRRCMVGRGGLAPKSIKISPALEVGFVHNTRIASCVSCAEKICVMTSLVGETLWIGVSVQSHVMVQVD
jgi:hypothetical protein